MHQLVEVLDFGDDIVVQTGSISVQSDGQAAIVSFDPTLPDAVYGVTVNGITDLAGNPLAPFSFSFGASLLLTCLLL